MPTAAVWAEQTIRRFYWMLGAVCLALLATECVALAAVFEPLRPLSFPDISGNILFAIGFGCPLVLHLSSLPGWRELGVTAAIAAILVGILWVVQGVGVPQLVTALGLASLAVLALRVRGKDWTISRTSDNGPRTALLFFLPACVSWVSTAPLAYLPFGGGQRLCIGRDLAILETQVIVPMVLQACRLELAPGAVVTPKPGITLRTIAGLPMLVRSP